MRQEVLSVYLLLHAYHRAKTLHLEVMDAVATVGAALEFFLGDYGLGTLLGQGSTRTDSPMESPQRSKA